METELTDLSPANRRLLWKIAQKGGIRGAEDPPEGEEGEGGEGEGGEGDDGEGNPYGFSPEQQKQVDKIMQRTRRNASATAQREFLKSIGIDDPAALKAIVDRDQKRRTDEMSDLEKAQQAERRATERAAAAEAETAKLRLEGKVDRALIGAGVDPKKVVRVRGMLDDFEADADEETIEDAVEDLKQDFPDLFSEEELSDDERRERDERQRRQEGPPRSDPGRQPRSRTQPKDKREQARSKFQERHPEYADRQ